MKRLFAFLPVLLIALSAPAAELKIGLVDMNKAFTEFYKTKEAQGKLQGFKTKLQEQWAERMAAYKKLRDDVEKKGKEARDTVLGEQARAKAGSEFQTMMQELKSLETDLKEFSTMRPQQLENEAASQRKGLYEEILAVVNNKVKGGEYDLVLDKSAVSASALPVFLFIKDGAAPDVTAEIIVELNKNAPAGSTAPTPAPETKKAEKK